MQGGRVTHVQAMKVWSVKIHGATGRILKCDTKLLRHTLTDEVPSSHYHHHHYYFSTALCWALAAFSVYWSHAQSVGLLGRGISSSQCLYLYTHTIQTSMPWVGFEPTIPAFERGKTVHTLDRKATVIGTFKSLGALTCAPPHFKGVGISE
jgi:hypothetical protein